MLNLHSDIILKSSAGILHVILIMLVVAVLRGRESPIIGQMFDSTLWGIILNLGVISGNKALQKVADTGFIKGKPTQGGDEK